MIKPAIVKHLIAWLCPVLAFAFSGSVSLADTQTGAALACCFSNPHATRPCVLVPLGRERGIESGDVLMASKGDLHVGVIEIDTVFNETAAGVFHSAPTYSGPLCTGGETRASEPAEFDLQLIKSSQTGPHATRGKPPEIFVPRGPAPDNEAEPGEVDPSLRAHLVMWAEGDVTALPAPAPAQPATTETTSAAPAQELPPKVITAAHAEGRFEVVHLDPLIADQIKSSFYVEPGDYLLVDPWPGRPRGRVVLIGKDETIAYPGDINVSTRGRTITMLEQEIFKRLRALGQGSRVLITPVRNTSADDAQAVRPAIDRD